MKNFIKIENPCKESWENMEDVTEGKFCDVCSKKVWDLAGKDDAEIKDFVQDHPGICGRISKSNRNIAAVFLVSVALGTFSCASNPSSNHYSTETIADKKIKIVGKIDVLDRAQVKPSSIKLVTKSKLFHGKIDSENNFEIDIPESEIQENNIIKINFKKTFNKTTVDDYSIHLLTKTDLLLGKTLPADDDFFEIGEVVISYPPPENYFFIDGKSITEKRFMKILTENPHFEKVILDNEVFMKVIMKNSNVGKISLLYSE